MSTSNNTHKHYHKDKRQKLLEPVGEPSNTMIWRFFLCFGVLLVVGEPSWASYVTVIASDPSNGVRSNGPIGRNSPTTTTLLRVSTDKTSPENNTNHISDQNQDTMASGAARRMVGKLNPETSLLMVCDIQTKFRPLVWRGETVVRTSQYMTSVAKALKIPVVATQQYTKVFGPTVPEVFASAEDLEACPIFEKKKFSMMTDEVQAHVDQLNKTSFLLVGIEAHVCLQQTALDLLEQGKDVHVIVDGVSSQQPIDREIALQRMSQAGAYLTTAQSAAFMLMQSANHENFKAVSKLTVEHMKLENEFNEALKK